jgi:hypothetical protein
VRAWRARPSGHGRPPGALQEPPTGPEDGAVPFFRQRLILSAELCRDLLEDGNGALGRRRRADAKLFEQAPVPSKVWAELSPVGAEGILVPVDLVRTKILAVADVQAGRACQSCHRWVIGVVVEEGIDLPVRGSFLCGQVQQVVNDKLGRGLFHDPEQAQGLAGPVLGPAREIDEPCLGLEQERPVGGEQLCGPPPSLTVAFSGKPGEVAQGLVLGGEFALDL